MTGHVCEGNTTSEVYIVFPFVFDSMLGGWTSNSGGTCPEARVEPGVLFVIIKKGGNVICGFDDVTNSGTL